MRFDARIYNERPPASPMFMFHKAVNTVQVVAGISPGEGDPKKIIERSRQKIAVFSKNNERNAFCFRASEVFGQGRAIGISAVIGESRRLNGQNAGHDKARP